MRQAMCHNALIGGLAGLEGRVIFPAFGQYIQLHPPWNYIAVTVALYGAAALAAAHLSGRLHDFAFPTALLRPLCCCPSYSATS